MKVVLHLAVSEDGYIAKPNGDSSWVSPIDEELFKKRARDLGAVVIGRKTFEQYKGVIYPVDGSLNIVFTHDTNSDYPYTASMPRDACNIAIKNGALGLLIAGGAQTADAFLKESAVDEIYLSIHPLKLVEGIRPDINFDKFTLIHKKPLNEGIVEEYYRRS